jgi:pyruvate, orthophosphate dikinase
MTIVHIKTGASAAGTPETIGAKAAILARVASSGLPVPPAFVLPIDLGAAMMQGDKDAERAFADGLEEGIAFLEEETVQSFGHPRDPLLVSVRSGAARSMPGMLDTVLDVGCTSEATRGLIRMTGNPRFAFDCRRRFLEAFAETVLGLDFAPFRAKREALIAEASAAGELDLDSEALERLSYLYEDLIAASGEELPDAAMEQLTSAARAVYRSFQSERCSIYRRLQGYEDLKGSAVMVQAMVFGNRGTNSASGVAFSRDPSTGAPSPVIDVLFEAQGEDVVSGRGRPLTETELAGAAPGLAAELHAHLRELERDFRDVQDIEFTIEDGRLWILQARAAKRTARAALKVAVDFVHEGLCSPEEALQRLSALDLRNLAVARFASHPVPAACGVGAAGGVAVGRAAFDTASAKRLAASGESVVLVRPDIDTSDVAGLAAASGVLTAMGGRTAHASLIARQMGKACVVSCSGLVIDEAAHRVEIGGVPLLEGDWLSVDGDTGEVYLGQIEIVTERPEAMLAEVESWREEAAKPRGRTALGVAE